MALLSFTFEDDGNTQNGLPCLHIIESERIGLGLRVSRKVALRVSFKGGTAGFRAETVPIALVARLDVAVPAGYTAYVVDLWRMHHHPKGDAILWLKAVESVVLELGQPSDPEVDEGTGREDLIVDFGLPFQDYLRISPIRRNNGGCSDQDPPAPAASQKGRVSRLAA